MRCLIWICVLSGGVVASCSKPGVQASLSRERLTVALLEPGNCILGGDVIDESDVTLVTFSPKSDEKCHSELDMVGGRAPGFQIKGDLSHIQRERYYMIVVDNNRQWEKRIRVKAK